MICAQVLGEVAFSKKFGFLEAGVDVDRAIKTIDDSQWYNGLIGQVPWLDHIFRRNPLWQFIPFLATKNALVTRVAMGQLEKRTNPQGEKVEYKDLLNSLIEAQKQHPEALGKGDVFAIAHGAIFAGSDSTASTMQSFMWQVVSNKRVYEKLMKEILAADLSDMVTYNEAQNLPYFQACLKEAMRINPAVGLNITRKVPLGGAELGCHKLPGGTEVAVNGWVLHRDTSIFGEDAEVFRPERWIEGDKENIKRMERCMFQVRFLSSPRSCSRANCLLVWWRIPCLHRSTSRSSGNEQGLTSAATTIRNPACQSQEGPRTPFQFLRCTVGSFDIPNTKREGINAWS